MPSLNLLREAWVRSPRLADRTCSVLRNKCECSPRSYGRDGSPVEQASQSMRPEKPRREALQLRLQQRELLNANSNTWTGNGGYHFHKLSVFFSYSVVASAVSVVEACRDISLSTGDGQWHNRLVKQAGSVPGCPLDSAGGCGRKKVTAKLSCLMERMSRPLQDTPSARGSVRDMLLLRLWRVKDRNCLPAAAVRLYNQPCSHQTKHTTTERFTRVISVYPKTLQYQYSLCVTQIQFW